MHERAKLFLSEGEYVRLVMKFKGREIVHKGLGEVVLDSFLRSCTEVGTPTGIPVLDGKRLVVTLSPRKRG